jgi:hypothetical protein
MYWVVVVIGHAMGRTQVVAPVLAKQLPGGAELATGLVVQYGVLADVSKP